MEYNSSLSHYGVLGMHWGVRRTPQQLGRAKNYTNDASKIVKETKKINDSIKSIHDTTKNTAKSENLSSMTDKELRERINRMDLERRYRTLSSESVKKGNDYINEVLKTSGEVLTTTGKALGAVTSILTIVSTIDKMKNGH